MRYDLTMYALHEPRQPEGDGDDGDQLEQRREERLLTRGDRKPQLDPLSALLALGRSGHGLG